MRIGRAVARLSVSLLGGVALFLVVSVASGVLSTYTDNRVLRLLLAMPTRWPRYLYVYLYPFHPKPSLYFSDTPSLVALLVCNVALYTLVVHLLLKLLPTLRRPKLEYQPPPAPRTPRA